MNELNFNSVLNRLVEIYESLSIGKLILITFPSAMIVTFIYLFTRDVLQMIWFTLF
ncbi:hypothetical protein HNR44_002205 [Geomicrobium halophilum]|uniref:Uncharacterized protein n=1 Tax=Geomicrobium halophilum TaxID=549000 RepID=A0A841PZM7_9BACL|nr:hypothetical protein [Geomicrobium halophilum]MBB6450222.1 hypothetical protein [Geomicrobium halophilum]